MVLELGLLDELLPEPEVELDGLELDGLELLELEPLALLCDASHSL